MSSSPGQTTPQATADNSCTPEKIQQQLQTIQQLGQKYDSGDLPEESTPEFASLQQQWNAAFESLRKCKAQAVPALLSLTNDQNGKNTRYSAVIALGSIGPEAEAAIPPLIELLKASDQGVHFYAAQSLANIGVEAAGALIQALKIPETNHDAAYALGRIKPFTQQIKDVLTQVVNDETVDLELRWMAATGLDRNGEDKEAFFAEHNLPSPYQESLKCLRENEDWESVGNDSSHRNIYIFDVYTKQCVRQTSIPVPRSRAENSRPMRTEPKALLKAGEKLVKKILGKE